MGNNKEKNSKTKKLFYLLPVLVLTLALATESKIYAKEGADDPPGHVRHSGTDERKSDDGAHRDRHSGLDDNKVGDGAHQARHTGDDDGARNSLDDNVPVSGSSSSSQSNGSLVTEDNPKADDKGVALVEDESLPELALNEKVEDKGVLAAAYDSIKAILGRLLSVN